ncbi:MAG: mechanosensitive ion channel family protein [Eubacteriales bacterium]|nr:mechanosensitive ion channel family protein [Eubacteriales bacterium]
MSKEKKTRIPAGKLMILLIIGYVIAGMFHPEILFFLNPAQQQAVSAFQEAYFTQYNPIQTGEGSFDPLRLVSITVLAAECWAIDVIVNLINRNWKMKSRHAETIKGLVCNCIKYFIVIYAIIFGLSILGVNMVAVITSLGVLGLIVGFGAQTLIEDVITGLFVIFEGQFHVGDIVYIDDFRGTVTSIGIRTTQITDMGGNIKIINNSDIRTIMNLSEVNSTAISTISISYSASLEQAEAVIQEVAERLHKEDPELFLQPPSYIGVDELGPSSVDLKVVALVEEKRVHKARRIMNRELKLAMDRAGIEIPFPQVVVHQGKDQ